MEGEVIPLQRPFLSRRALVTAALLVTGHFVAWGWVVSQSILYDSGNILWWMVAFLILPAAALGCLLISLAKSALGLRENGEEA